MSKHVTARISDELVAKVDEHAERDGLSRSQEFGKLVEEGMAARGTTAGPVIQGPVHGVSEHASVACGHPVVLYTQASLDAADVTCGACRELGAMMDRTTPA